MNPMKLWELVQLLFRLFGLWPSEEVRHMRIRRRRRRKAAAQPLFPLPEPGSMVTWERKKPYSDGTKS